MIQQFKTRFCGAGSWYSLMSPLRKTIQKHLTFAQHERIEKAPPSSQEEACVQEEPGSLTVNSVMV